MKLGYSVFKLLNELQFNSISFRNKKGKTIDVLLGDIKFIKIGKLNAPRKNTTVEQRILFICRNVYRLLQEYDIDVLVLEGGFIGKFPKAGMMLERLRTALRFTAYSFYDERWMYFSNSDSGIDSKVEEIGPTEVKKYFTGNGNCKKDMIVANVKSLCDCGMIGLSLNDTLSEDECDAIALGYTYAHKFRGYNERCNKTATLNNR